MGFAGKTTTVPGVPTIGTATATGSTTATVSFTAPASNGGSPITSYQAISTPGNITGTLSQAGSGTITVSGLTTGTAYTFTVTATNSVGTGSASSASNQISTYSAPANTVAPAVSGTATFGQTLTSTAGTWTGTATITYAYQWQRAGVNISGATGSTYVLTLSDVGNAIRCVVTATNTVSSVSANSNATASVAAIAPSAPTIGTATATGSTTANVAFTAPASNGGATITSYTATSSPGGITGTLSQAGSGTITVSGLSGTTSYTFTVTATNSIGTSSVSSASNSITTPAPPLSLWAWAGDGWGLNGGQTSPAQVGSSTDWTSKLDVSEPWHAIKADGTLWGWGMYNGYAGVGNGDRSSSSVNPPVQIASGSWKTVASSLYGGQAIKTDGTMWTWGWAFNGRLGTGQTSDKLFETTPVQMGSDTNWDKISAGFFCSAAIKTNGTLWTWGLNNNGQLGLGDADNRSYPTQVGSDTNWNNVSCGSSGYFAMATKTDGTLWLWGKNSYGQLGLGDTTTRYTPTQVGVLTTWSKVSAATGNNGFSSFAIKTDGTLWSWGANWQGNLGLGDTTNRSSPCQVGSSTWLAVTAGGTNTGGIKTNGTLWTWGFNYYGQLGLGDTTTRSVPTQVGALNTWVLIAMNYGSAVAVRP
jgi:hypothetical protein